VKNSFIFCWFTKTLRLGNIRRLKYDDLPNIPRSLLSLSSYSHFVLNNRKILCLKSSWMIEECTRDSLFTFVKLLWNAYHKQIIILGIYKLLSCIAVLVTPVLLGIIVKYVSNINDTVDIKDGLYLSALLLFCLVTTAYLNVTCNYQGCLLQLKARSSLIRSLFNRSISINEYTCGEMLISEAKLTTLVQVDIDRVSGVFSSLHDLWTLPLQVIIAIILLYYQVKIAFVTGVIAIVVMIPINFVIAKKINKATTGTEYLYYYIVLH
jgi:ATP-binding cassette subfamily C (CFTR/MRP) protein 10